MDTFVILAAGMKFGYALVAVLAIVTLLKWFDRTNGTSFGRDALTIIHGDPRATADYYGKRIIAVCILVGLVIA